MDLAPPPDSEPEDDTAEYWVQDGHPIENPAVRPIPDDPLCVPHPDEPGMTPDLAED